jgi:hypothetical protein
MAAFVQNYLWRGQSSCGASHRIVSARIEEAIEGSNLVPDSPANDEMRWPSFVLAPTP